MKEKHEDSDDEETSKSLQYRRYTLKAPDEDEDGSYGSSNESDKEGEATDRSGNDDDELNAPARLMEEVNVLTGIKSYEFAELKEESGHEEVTDSEIAIIGFWSLKDGVFRCVHSVIVPNPMKREVLDVEGTVLC